jgi:uncharacterized membrane protein
MTDPALTLRVSYRRDAILLMATALGVGAWAWSHTPVEMAAAGVICALLYLALVTMVRNGQHIERESGIPAGRGTVLIWVIMTLISGGTTVALLTTATGEAFAQPILTLAVAVLTIAWQGWFYFWMEI